MGKRWRGGNLQGGGLEEDTRAFEGKDFKGAQGGGGNKRREQGVVGEEVAERRGKAKARDFKVGQGKGVKGAQGGGVNKRRGQGVVEEEVEAIFQEQKCGEAGIFRARGL